MPKDCFNLQFNITTPWLWIHWSTPQFSTENPKLRPSWWPHWDLHDFGEHAYVDSRYMWFFTWFFHLTLAWGKTLPMRVEQHDQTSDPYTG